jgi:uncharacterized alkaline shock family protein YloU
VTESTTRRPEDGAQAQRPVGGPGQRTASLRSERGNTVISDSVVAKIAGLAAREIPGVYDLGRGIGRTFGALRQRMPSPSTAGGGQAVTTQGVSVEVGQKQTAVDLDLVIFYGQSIVEVSEAVRRNVINRVEGLTGLEVTEVNIAVDDLYVEGEEQPPEQSRVQ